MPREEEEEAEEEEAADDDEDEEEVEEEEAEEAEEVEAGAAAAAAEAEAADEEEFSASFSCNSLSDGVSNTPIFQDCLLTREVKVNSSPSPVNKKFFCVFEKSSEKPNNFENQDIKK